MRKVLIAVAMMMVTLAGCGGGGTPAPTTTTVPTTTVPSMTTTPPVTTPSPTTTAPPAPVVTTTEPVVEPTYESTAEPTYTDETTTEPTQGPEPCSGYDRCGAGPLVDDGPGCGPRAVAAGVFNAACSEYQGYLDPGVRGGRAPSSGDIMTKYACDQGQLSGPICDPYE